MNILYIIKILVVILVISCSSGNTANIKSMDKQTWQSFTLWLEDTSIVYGNFLSDSLEIKSKNGETINFYIGKSRLDSIFYWSDNLINFRQPDQFQFCTDYVGKLRIEIHYSSILTKQVNFTSICNWKNLSIETRKIDSVLKLAIKR